MNFQMFKLDLEKAEEPEHPLDHRKRDLIYGIPNGLVVFPTFFNLSLNFAIRSS